MRTVTEIEESVCCGELTFVVIFQESHQHLNVGRIMTVEGIVGTTGLSSVVRQIFSSTLKGMHVLTLYPMISSFINQFLPIIIVSINIYGAVNNTYHVMKCSKV